VTDETLLFNSSVQGGYDPSLEVGVGLIELVFSSDLPLNGDGTKVSLLWVSSGEQLQSLGGHDGVSWVVCNLLGCGSLWLGSGGLGLC